MQRIAHIVTALILVGAALWTLPRAASAAPHWRQLDPANIEMTEPNGEIRVEMWRAGAWHSVGGLPYDIYYRSHRIDLAAFVPVEGDAQIRLTAEGAGATHVDAISLDGAAPRSVQGGGPQALEKLRRVDHDVVHAEGRSLVMLFAEPRRTATLTVTARIEGEQVCGSPFQLPPANAGKPTSGSSSFYPYRLGTKPSAAPFAREWAAASTGHPSGYINLWAHDDGETLYVTVDFTGDNTVDGDADWAEVYVKSPAGLRRFRVSVPEQRWGVPRFVYTDSVPYQHKVYDFAIPLTALGLASTPQPGKLGLAFAAYGTCASGAEFYGLVKYSTTSDRHLIVFTREIGSCNRRVVVQSVDGAGSPMGAATPVSGGTTGEDPAVAYNAVDDELLVVWFDDTTYDLMGQRVSPAGATIGANFTIAEGSLYAAGNAVDFDPVTQRYLVVWRDQSNLQIRGSLVAADGTLVDIDGDSTPEPDQDHFVIADANIPEKPAVAFEPQANRFLAVWEASADQNIYARLVNPDGTTAGAAFVVSNAVNIQGSPSVARIESADPLLVLFSDQRTGVDVFGQLVQNNGNLVDHGGDGTPADDNFAASTAAAVQGEPQLAGDTHNQRFLAVFTDQRSGYQLYGQLIGADATLADHGDDGTPADDNFLVSTPTSGNIYHGFIAHNPNCQNYLVAHDHDDPIQYAVLGPCLVPHHDYGDVDVSISSSQTFSLTNTDSGPLDVGTLALSGTDAAMLALANDNCSNQSVAGDGTCTFDVTFTPTSVGAKNAEVTVPTDYPSSPTLRLVLDGNGVDGGTGGSAGTAGSGGSVSPPPPADGEDEGGCGCRVSAHGPAGAHGALTLLAVALLLARRRRSNGR